MTTTPTSLEVFFRQYPSAGYQKNQVILAAGDNSDYFYYVETGAVKMSLISAAGKKLVVHIFFPESFFSLLSLVSDGTNTYDFVTMLPTTVRKIPQFEALAFLKTHPDMLFELQLRLLKGLQGVVHRLEQATLTTAYNQVAGLLAYFAAHFSEAATAEDHSQTLTIKITHQEIADWLGLSRENVSIQMKQLEENGLITSENHLIKILQPAALRM